MSSTHNTGLVTVEVPEFMKEKLYDSIMESLVAIVSSQKSEILKLRKMLPNNGTGVRKYKRNRASASYAFAGVLSNAPKYVKDEAHRIKNEQGYEAAVQYVNQWRLATKSHSGK